MKSIVVNGDPLEDISVLCAPERIATVFQDGEIVARRGDLARPR